MLIRHKQICALCKNIIFFLLRDNFGTGTDAHESLKDDPERMMTLCRWFSPWLWVSATLTITQILWACQENLPPFSESIKLNSLLSHWAQTDGLSAPGFWLCFQVPTCTSLNLFKNNHQSCKSRFSDQEIFSDLWTAHVGCNWQSLITHHRLFFPAHFSPSLCAWLRTLFKMRLQQDSLINTGTQVARTGFGPSDWPVSPKAQLYWSTWWSSKFFCLNPIPGKHLAFTPLIGPVQIFAYLLRIIL